jgi:hypothetical protein
LFAALLACGHPQSVAWEPYSKRAPTNQIAVKAIQVGEGDLGALKKAGALPIGTLTMRGRDLNAVIDATATEAAEFGGTHYMMGRWSEQTSTVAYHGSGTADSWTVVPLTSTTSTARFVVLRVPVSGWQHLPDILTPQTTAKEL